MATDSCRQALRTAIGAPGAIPRIPRPVSPCVRSRITPEALATTIALVRRPHRVDRGKPRAGRTRRRELRGSAGTGSGAQQSGLVGHGCQPRVATGQLRGFFDYATGQVVRIASVTDGTSNTLIVGEVLPWQTADSNFWTFNGCTAGTTVPLNWQTNKMICSDAAGPAFGSADWQCRFSYASKGFKSAHPGGANFCLADGSVRFLKASISLATYCALGSRAGTEVVSSDAY